MKAIIFAITILCLSTTVGCAQNIAQDKVPGFIQIGFKKQFPHAIKPQWEMEETDYEVNFNNEELKFSAKYNKEGDWLETEQEIKKTDLPAAVKHAINKEFPDAELKETEKITYPNNKTVYEMEVKQDKQKFEVQYATDGQLLKKVEMTKKEAKN